METCAYLQLAQAHENADLAASELPNFSVATSPTGGAAIVCAGMLAATSTIGWSQVAQAQVAVPTGLFQSYSSDTGFTNVAPAAPLPELGRGQPVPNCNPSELFAFACTSACGGNATTPIRPTPPIGIAPLPIRPDNPGSPDTGFRPVRPGGSVFLRRGDVGPDVVYIQDLLRSAGYFHAASTGFYATLTQEGVTQLQRDLGLGVDGIVGPETLAALEGRNFRPVAPSVRPIDLPATTLQVGDRGNEVSNLQSLLAALGYYSGPIDGVYGASTLRAVAAFQSNFGLTATGTADRTTINAIGQVYSRTV